MNVTPLNCNCRTCLSELLSSLQLGIERAEKALKEIKDSSLVSGDSVPGSTTVMGQPPVLVIPPLIVPVSIVYLCVLCVHSVVTCVISLVA